MSLLYPIPDNEDLAATLAALIHTKYGSSFEHQSFITLFNHDISIFEKFITNPPSEVKMHNEAYAKQERHNQALKEGKARWDESDKQVTVGAKAVHELALRKKEYEYAQKNYDTYLDKKKIIQHFTHDEEPWIAFAAMLSSLPPEKSAEAARALEKLKIAWKEQGILAFFNADDLGRFLEELKKIENFVEFLFSVCSANTPNELEKQLLQALSRNQTALQTLKEQALASMAWKIKAASKKQSLWVDDGYWALISDLTAIFASLPAKALDAVVVYTDLGKNLISRSIDPKRFAQFVSHLEQSEKWKGYWLQSFWAKPNDDFIIPIEVRDDYLIPAFLAASIPSTLSWRPDDNLKFRFFRNADQVLVSLNECHRQIQTFKEGIGVAARLKLEILTETPGFRSVLMIKSVIDAEKQKIAHHMPTWLSRTFMGSRQYQFLNNWLVVLLQLETKTHQVGHDIANILVKRLSSEFIYSIREHANLFPSNLVKDIRQFVDWYAGEEDKAELAHIFDPLYIFSEFNFLKPKKEGFKRDLDLEAITMFLSFAQKYWAPDKYVASQLLSKMIKGEWYPADLSEEKYLAQTIACLLPIDERPRHFKILMSALCERYIVKTGEVNSPLAYRFLARYSPKSAEMWDQDRRQNLVQKFILFNAIFSVELNHEYELYSEAALEKDNNDLSKSRWLQYLNDLSSVSTLEVNYIQLVSSFAKKYLDKYDGKNDHYAELIAEISTLNNEPSLFEDYLNRRMRYHISMIQAGKKLKLSPLDQTLFHNKRFGRIVNKCFINAIDILGKEVESESLCDWIEKFCEQPVKEHYRVKRLERLLDQNDVKLTEKYAQALLRYSKKDAEAGRLVTSRDGRTALQSVYTHHLKRLVKEGRWEGNAFIIMASFRPSESQDNISYLNYLWLREFLFHPEKFNCVEGVQRPSVDLSFHKDNLAIPNDTSSIGQFLGSYTDDVKPLLFHLFSKFNPALSRDVFKLLKSYLMEPEFRQDKDWLLLSNMVNTVEKANRTFNIIKSGDFSMAGRELNEFITEFEAVVILAGATKQSADLDKEKYYAKVVNGFSDALLEYYRSLVLSEDQFSKLCNQQFYEAQKEKSAFEEKIAYRNLPAPYNERFEFIRQNASKAVKAVYDIGLLPLEKIKLDFEEASLLAETLPLLIKSKLSEFLSEIFLPFQKGDDQYHAVHSYIKVLNQNYSLEDIENLKKFKYLKKDRYPKLACDLASRAIEAIEGGQDLSQVFKMSEHSRLFYENIAESLDAPSVQKLTSVLAAKISLMESKAFELHPANWRAHGAVYHWLAKRDQSLIKFVNSKVQDYLEYLSNAVIHPLDQMGVMRAALFVRSFGTHDALLRLEESLELSANQQRKILMRGGCDARAEKYIEFANNIIQCAGSQEQKQKSTALIEDWSIYRHYSSNLLRTEKSDEDDVVLNVRIRAIDQAYDVYFDHLNIAFFKYFIDQFLIKDAPGFYKDIKKFCADLEKNHLKQGYYIDPNQILQQYPYEYFKKILEKHARPAQEGWLHRPSNLAWAPVERDGMKLFVAICVSIRASETKSIWQKKLREEGAKALKQFSPNRVSQPLHALIDQAQSAFKLGTHDFIKSLDNAIGESEAYFEKTQEEIASEGSNEKWFGWRSKASSTPTLRI